ncbi:MAG TPA: M56 family metallopeptidase [Candidatus Binatia bacterium]|nr:M56 family metallopeptidase [Candidatus Binatia bacterium]
MSQPGPAGHPSAPFQLLPAGHAPAPFQPGPGWAPPHPGSPPVRPARAGAALVTAGLWICLCGWSLATALQGQPVLGAVSGFFDLQLSVLAFRLGRLQRGDDLDPVARGRVGLVMSELCWRLGWPPLGVRVVSFSAHLMGVRMRDRPPTLVVAQPFVDRLTDRELRTLVAHELAHIGRRDNRATTVRNLAALVLGAVLCGLCFLVSPTLSQYPLGLTALYVGLVLGSLALGPLNRSRETRADRDAVMISADPEALAAALRTMGEITEQVRGELFSPPVLRWLLWPWSMRPTTHPPVAARIAAVNRIMGLGPPAGP